MTTKPLLAACLLVITFATGGVPSSQATPASVEPPPFTLAGETVFTSSGSTAGRFVVDHEVELADWEFVTDAVNAIVMVDGPVGMTWYKNRDSLEFDWGSEVPPLDPGTYFIYMASTPPLSITLKLRFANETGHVTNALDIPVRSWMGPLSPTTMPDSGEGMVVSKWTSTQPFPGDAYNKVYHHALYQPYLFHYHEEFRWSLPEGVYNCFAFDAGSAVGIGTGLLKEGGDTFMTNDWMHHNGTATLEIFKYSVGVPTSWLTVVYWLERLPDDVPHPGSPPLQDWAHPVRMPGDFGNSIGYDYGCASYSVPRSINAWSAWAGDQLGHAGIGVEYHFGPFPV